MEPAWPDGPGLSSLRVGNPEISVHSSKLLIIPLEDGLRVERDEKTRKGKNRRRRPGGGGGGGRADSRTRSLLTSLENSRAVESGGGARTCETRRVRILARGGGQRVGCLIKNTRPYFLRRVRSLTSRVLFADYRCTRARDEEKTDGVHRAHARTHARACAWIYA